MNLNRARDRRIRAGQFRGTSEGTPTRYGKVEYFAIHIIAIVDGIADIHRRLDLIEEATSLRKK
jgi:hypothetical protein